MSNSDTFEGTSWLHSNTFLKYLVVVQTMNQLPSNIQVVIVC